MYNRSELVSIESEPKANLATFFYALYPRYIP